MNIKILDSWLRDYLKTKATPQEIAEIMSLTSVSIERIEPYQSDFIYDVEVTTNRPDLMSVVGLAKEAAAVLTQFGITATFEAPTLEKANDSTDHLLPITIKSNKELVNRVCAVIMEVAVKKSPKVIQERLETSDIRSLNNIIDVTNYVMRTIGHPTHVFDYDKLKTQTLIIRESRKNEKVTTLDGKNHTLPGGDIVADDGLGNIIDLLGIMGLENSVVDENTKRILFFIDNIDPHKIRKTSMTLGIRTEAAQLNEKNVDPELAMDALLAGISLYKEIAEGKMLSPIIDIYDHRPQERTISVPIMKIETILGIPLSTDKALRILERLHFTVEVKDNLLLVNVPSNRLDDISLPEDIVEEIARVYGYHNLPNELPPLTIPEPYNLESNPFYWENKAKQALKYWGMTEVYTYPMVSEKLYEGPNTDAVTLQNPLGEDFTYMRRSLVPSLLAVIDENKKADVIHIFEIANIYKKKGENLPEQHLMLAGVSKDNTTSFFKVKGVIEQLCTAFGIRDVSFDLNGGSAMETKVLSGSKRIGEIEILDQNLINFELDFDLMVELATLQKTYTPLSKFPPIIEDLSFVIDDAIATGDIMSLIKKQSHLIAEVTLLDRYKDSRTFHILYQDPSKNLTTEEVTDIREKIVHALQKTYRATQK